MIIRKNASAFKKKTQITALLFDKIFIKVLIKFSDYNNVYLTENIAKFLKYIKKNDYVIKLEEDK